MALDARNIGPLLIAGALIAGAVWLLASDDQAVAPKRTKNGADRVPPHAGPTIEATATEVEETPAPVPEPEATLKGA